MQLLSLVQVSNGTQGDKWLTAPEVIAAVVTSIFTIAGIALKDYFFKLVDERRSDRKAQSAIYERYSYPLVTSAVSLLNRLDEILYKQHRPVYLLGKGLASSKSPGGAYRAYKKLSTVYRLAAVLGWIRACRREFSYLRVADFGRAKGVHNSIEEFETSLADGGWVEWDRVTRLCDLWRLCNADALESSQTARDAAIQVDNLIWDHLENAHVEDVSLLDEGAKRSMCRSVADCLSSHIRTNQVTEASMDRTWPDAFAVLGMRESWIYRDWQSAIGDLMIQPANKGDRRFEVIGFGDFERLILTSDETQRLSMQRLFDVFDDLNLSIEDRFDARPTQIRSMARATADLILAIDGIQGEQSIVSDSSRFKAKEISKKQAADDNRPR